jgi:ADP-heptose:LPS heptosyltransferase
MRILIIQTAFIGDVILATSVLEKLKKNFPDADFDFFLRKGNEQLFKNHPFIKEIFIWDKKKKKFLNLFRLLKQIRKIKYDYVVNLHRHTNSGLITFLSKSNIKAGFSNNPFSFCYDYKVKFNIKDNKHETERNHEVIRKFTNEIPEKPKLYPGDLEFEYIKKYTNKDYICIAPASVWFTKQFPVEMWIQFTNKVENILKIYLLGSKSDFNLCNQILLNSENKQITNLTGELSLLESAALMKNAVMNYVNDSSPLHLASAVNASVTAIFCSTLPEFGFTPLSANSKIVQTREFLKCRPCGNHGKKYCPENHFKCAYSININELI